MLRRQIIHAALVAGLAGLAGRAAASEAAKGSAEAETLDLSGVALPVVQDGRVRNYVFVTVRLHLAPGKPAADVRAKQAFYRDALVRTGHRAPFVLRGDPNRLNEAAINAAVVAIAGVVSGHGVVARSEVSSQTPRRRMA